MTDNTTDFFDGIGEGVGAPSALLSGKGDSVYGDIVKMFKRDYVEFGQKDPKRDADGNAVQQLVIVLQTDNRNWANVAKVPKVDASDPNSPERPPHEDDGLRAVYVPEGKNIQFAIGKAITAAKAKFQVGGKLGVRIDDLRDTGKGNPLKEHVAVYTPPSAGDAFFGNAPQAPAQQTAPATPAPQSAPPVQQQAPAQQAAPAAPAADPWASSAPAAPAGDPWATPAANQPPPF